MITLAAPANGPKTILQLPNPEFGNEEGLNTSIEYDESIDGTVYTNIEGSGSKRLSFTFRNVGRGKMDEVQEFFQKYYGSKIRLTDHNGTGWIVMITSEPITFEHVTRASNGMSRKEAGGFTLEFISA